MELRSVILRSEHLATSTGDEQRLQRREDGALVALSGGTVGPWRCLHKKRVLALYSQARDAIKNRAPQCCQVFSGPAAMCQFA